MSVRTLSLAVIGSGVSGLSTAICLAQNGHKVTILTTKRFAKTTSAVAAAFWYPYAVKGYRRHWASISYHQFRSLKDEPGSGVSLAPGVEYFDVHSAQEARLLIDAQWWKTLPGVQFAELSGDEIPRHVDFRPDPLGPRSFTCGAVFCLPVINMPVYLGYLDHWFETGLGGTIREECADLERLCASSEFDAVVNCAGFAAGRLVQSREPSEQVTPVSGQIIRAEAPGVNRLVFIHTGDFSQPLYIVPRSGSSPDVVLGGSFYPLPSTVETDELPPPDPEIDKRILHCCKAIDPALGATNVRLLESMVGLRPCRDQVRVETSRSFGKPVIHNYGHGGAGVTLSWGCAYRIADLVEDL